jgi:hypothetical protein
MRFVKRHEVAKYNSIGQRPMKKYHSIGQHPMKI